MKPKDPTQPARKPARAALRLGLGPGGVSTLVAFSVVKSFRDRAALLHYLTSPGEMRPFSQLWLTPWSPGDWSTLVEPFVRAGWKLGISRRLGVVTNLRIYKPGAPLSLTGEEYEPDEKLWLWSGRCASGLVDVPPGIDPADECRATLDQIEDVDAAIRARFPAVTLGTSLTQTSLEIFRTLLDAEIQVDPQLEVTLRAAGAPQGGRQELFALPGTLVRRAEREDADGEMVPVPGEPQPVDLDVTSAYPTALEVSDVGARSLGEGSESAYADDLSIACALVEVPEALRYGPLRYEPPEGAACYPTGTLLGTWTGAQIRAAEAVGCTVRQVHTVWRFAAQDVFYRFGEEMARWRRELPPGVVADACKSIAVRGVGAWQMAPRLVEVVAGEPPADRLEGARVLGHGLWELPVQVKQHQNALLPAGILVVGQVQAWAALVLAGAQREEAGAIYWHTDGGAFRDRARLERALAWATVRGAPTTDRWRLRDLAQIQVWGPGQRLEVRADGERKVAGSGISRELGEEEIARRLGAAEALAEIDRASAGRRVWEGERDRAPTVGEVDPEMAAMARRMTG